eukprot:12679510-Alexandrium_andersonii.AAC.1
MAGTAEQRVSPRSSSPCPGWYLGGALSVRTLCCLPGQKGIGGLVARAGGVHLSGSLHSHVSVMSTAAPWTYLERF